MSNLSTFESKAVVRSYFTQDHLQQPEETILRMLKDRLRGFNMLDIGVGAGRTTAHLAHMAGSYTGIDYSKSMIEACMKKFSDLAKRGALTVGDARSMPMFDNHTFDFILFSYNGLDYMSHDDRLKALGEIRRIGKRGGYFCFSTHNLNTNLDQSVRPAFTPNPVKLAYRVGAYLLFKLLTLRFKRERERAAYAIVNDGAHRFRSWTYYIKPQEQIGQLTGLGFTDVRIFSLSDGKEILDPSALVTATDSWLYYLCTI